MKWLLSTVPNVSAQCTPPLWVITVISAASPMRGSDGFTPFAVLRVDKIEAQHLPSLCKSDYKCCNSRLCGRKHCSLWRVDTKCTSPILWPCSPFLFFPQINMKVYCSVSRCHLEMWWEIEWTVQSTAKLTYFNFRIKCNPQLQGEAVALMHWLDSLSKWVAHCLNRWQMLFETSCWCTTNIL